jgi:hypothetical protein
MTFDNTNTNSGSTNEGGRVDEDDEFSTWLDSHRVKTADESSHFSYLGGKYFIGEKDNGVFLKKYAEQLQRSSSGLFLIEKRTPVFKMLFDLDMIQPRGVSMPEVFALTALCCSVFRTYYPVLAAADQLTCYVYNAPNMAKKGWATGPDAPMVVKSGFHLIWPHLIVDQAQALHLREACIYAAKRELPDRVPPANPYADVLDETVLLKNGLRMVGSDKMIRCRVCSGTGKYLNMGKCNRCVGAKSVAENRVYVPYFVVNKDGVMDPALLHAVSREEDVFDRVRLSSLRVFGTRSTPGFVIPELAAIPASLALIENGGVAVAAANKKRARSIATSEDRESSEGKAASSRALSAGNAQEIGDDKLMFGYVQDMIRGCVVAGRQPWEHVTLKKFYLLKTSNRYMGKVVGVGANFCLNVGRQHSSSTVYFVLDALGLRQRCFCRKEGSSASLCKTFASSCFPLPPLLRAAMFQSAAPSAGAAAATAVGAVTPINGYVDPQKQLQAVVAANKLRAAVIKHAAPGLAPPPPVPPAHGAPLARPPASASQNLRQFGVYADFTPREIDQMRCVDLMDLDRRKMEEMREMARQVQEQCFQGEAAPSATGGGARRKRKR